MKKAFEKFFAPNKTKSIVAAALSGLVAVYQLYAIITQASALMELQSRFSGMGGGLLGSLFQVEIPTELYISFILTFFGYALLMLLFIKFLLPLPKHRFVVMGILAVYVLQGAYSLINTAALSKMNSLVLMILKPAELTPWYILSTAATAYLVLLVGTIINKRVEWIAALVAIFWAVYFIVSSAQNGITDPTTFALNLASQLAAAAVFLLHPVTKKAMFKRRYYDDDED